MTEFKKGDTCTATPSRWLASRSTRRRGPAMLVVELDGDEVVTAWADGNEEMRWHRAMVRRTSP